MTSRSRASTFALWRRAVRKGSPGRSNGSAMDNGELSASSSDASMCASSSFSSSASRPNSVRMAMAAVSSRIFAATSRGLSVGQRASSASATATASGAYPSIAPFWKAGIIRRRRRRCCSPLLKGSTWLKRARLESFGAFTGSSVECWQSCGCVMTSWFSSAPKAHTSVARRSATAATGPYSRSRRSIVPTGSPKKRSTLSIGNAALGPRMSTGVFTMGAAAYAGRGAGTEPRVRPVARAPPRRRESRSMRRLLPALFAVWLSSCNCSPSKPCNVTADCGPGLVCSGGVCQAAGSGGGGSTDGGTGGGVGGGGGGDAGSRQVVGIEVSPATASLSSTDGSQPTQAFSATVRFDDGSTANATNTVWDVDVPALGTIGPTDGLFTASGRVGGQATVRAQVIAGGQTWSATASVTVSLSRTTVGANVPADVATRFAATPVQDPSRSAGVVYPLDRVVFPQNVAPADVQWLNGVTGDLFRVTLSKPNAQVVGYVAEDGKHHWLVDVDAWRALAQTSITSDVTLTVDRWEAATQEVIAGAPISLRFVPAALTGSIYYWDIQRGRIVRIDDGTTTRTEFMPNPPAGTDGAQCVGCHAVSPRGRYMAGRLGGGENVGAVFDLTVDLTPNPPPTVWPVVTSAPTSQRWWFSSWSPDETRLVLSTNEGGAGGMAFMDPLTGQSVAVANVPGGKVTHPAWAPDGQKIAYVANLNGWGGDYTAGDLHVVPVTAPDTLGTPTVLHSGASLAGATPSGNADSYPTWTPDSKKLAFAHGNGCRSETHQSALYLLDADGSNVVRLSNATGGPTSNDSFQPRFSPFRAGGYYWLTFLSRRDYGNAQVGTRGTGFQQIWVVGVKENAAPGNDPSEVAFWLPGQDTRSRNIAAYWAPRACRQAGDGCTVGSECCSGDCRAGAGGALVCSPPPPERCRQEGETCGGTGDCCPGRGLICQMNVCVLDIQ